MLLNLQASTSRLPRLSHGLATSSRHMTKAPLTATSQIPTPQVLLDKIGRGAEKRLASHAESWQTLNEAWQKGSAGIKASGLNVKDRRYVLWAFSRYSQGAKLEEFLSPPKGAKEIRGWGPRVQNGKRVK